MTQMIQSRFLSMFASFVMVVVSLALQAQPRGSALPDKEQLLALVAYSESGATRTLSLWRVPLAADPHQLSEGVGKGQFKGLPPNTAFVLVDGTPANPSAGNLVWALKV